MDITCTFRPVSNHFPSETYTFPSRSSPNSHMDNLDAHKAGHVSPNTSSSTPPTSDPCYPTANDQSMPPLPSSFFEQNLATFIVPSDISPWAGSMDLNGAIDTPGTLYSEQALAPALRQDDTLGQFSPSLSQSFLQVSPAYTLQSPHQADRAYSPHVFHQRPLPSSLTPPQSTDASNTSNSASPSPAPASSRMHTFAVAPQQPFYGNQASASASNAPRAVNKVEPDDATWNLVPSNAPWKMRGVTGSSLADSSSSGPVPSVMETGMFMRSPTPTKRQRTVQACEKCRGRKAKCDGNRDICGRCKKIGLVCEYAPQRKMRGPNRSGGMHRGSGASSSPSSTNMSLVPVLATNGMGDSSMESQHTGHVAMPPVANGHYHQTPPRSGIARATQPSPLTLNIPLPVSRTIHVAQSFPDLYAEATRASDNSSTSSSPISTVSFPLSADPYTSRPRSHTTSYSLGNHAIPSHSQYQQAQQVSGNSGRVGHGLRSGGGGTHSDVSVSDPSEPPSATSSAFGVDMWHTYPASLPPPSYPVHSMRAPGDNSPPGNGPVDYSQSEFVTYQSMGTAMHTERPSSGHPGSGHGSDDTIQPEQAGDRQVDQQRVADVSQQFDSVSRWVDGPMGWNGSAVIDVQKAYASELMHPGSAATAMPSSISPTSRGYGNQPSLPVGTWDHSNVVPSHEPTEIPMPHLELARLSVNSTPTTTNNYMWVSGEPGFNQSGHTVTFLNQGQAYSNKSPTDTDFKAWFADSPTTVLDVAANNDTVRNVPVYQVPNH
ncbi:hypothetical protein FRB94_008417 [Tulasnella sp. JGI-2019a]|nr:hypothetical protein FRB94_008417 [Tulasnella sp. JGI-2019a]